MKKENTLALNTCFVNQRINELELKQVWLASKIGVDKITINRWTSGKVKRIAKHNAELLAKCLECSIEDIILKDDIVSAGTYMDKQSAIENILSDNLISILYPLEKWDLAESLIKASMHPNIEPTKMSQLYNHLWCVNLKKNNFEQAFQYAYKSLSISKKYNDRRMFNLSLSNIATSHTLKGSYITAMKIYHYCLDIFTQANASKELASIHHNLALIYQFLCEFPQSIDNFESSIKFLSSSNDNSFKLSLTNISLANLYTELGNTEKSHLILDEAYKQALKSNYKNGIIACNLYQTDVFIVAGELENAKKIIKHDLKSLTESFVGELPCYEALARFYRMCGEYEKASDAIAEGLSLCSCHPFEEGRMLQERARLALAQKALKDEVFYRKKSNRIFKTCKLNNRICNTTIKEHGHQFDL